MTKLYKIRIRSLQAIGLLAAIVVFSQQTTIAQTTPPPAGTVNSPGSVLHGRTVEVADKILRNLGPSITQYNQVTNLNQLSGITSLSLYSIRSTFTSLQAGDFQGLTNLRSLSISKPYIYAYAYASPVPASWGGITYEYHASIQNPPPSYDIAPAIQSGLLDDLINLRSLYIGIIKLVRLGDGGYSTRIMPTIEETLDLLPSRTLKRLVNLQNLNGVSLARSISVPSALGVEEGTVAQIQLTPSDGDMAIVEYSTADGTAFSGRDYIGRSGRLLINKPHGAVQS